MSTRNLGLHLVLAMCLVGTTGDPGQAGCYVDAYPDAPKCVHEVDASGPPCVTFVKKECYDPWCPEGFVFCEEPFPGDTYEWCAPSTQPAQYCTSVSYRSTCRAYMDCCGWIGPRQVPGCVNIFGGRIWARESCTYASMGSCGSECESFNCGDTLCPGQAAVFKPTPTSPEAANADEYDWIWHYWDVVSAPPCGPWDASWQLIAPGHPWRWQEITDEHPCLVLSDPGRYRVKTYATFGGYVCYDPPGDWCEVTVTDWGHEWTNTSQSDTFLAAGETVTLKLRFDPWWMDDDWVTLSIAGAGGVVEIRHKGELLEDVSSITWSPPHCWGHASGSSVVIDPIANDNPETVDFDVTGINVGEVTFTLEFLGCTTSFKATVLCDLDIDSDNDDGKADPEQDAHEDQIEGDAPGKMIPWNNDDDDGNGVADFSDPTEVADPAKNDLVPTIVKVDVALAWRLRVEYWGDGLIKVWQQRTKGAGQELAFDPNGCTPWQFKGTGPLTQRLFVEGVALSSWLGDVLLYLETDLDNDGTFEPWDGDRSDMVRITVLAVDLDIDSDNTNGKGDPDRSAEEDQIEDTPGSPDTPGKFVAVNDNDDDMDGIPDFADGYDLDGVPSADDECAGEAFTPVILEMPDLIDIDTTIIVLDYDDSDPADVSRTGANPPYKYEPPADGRLRLWRVDGNIRRNKMSLLDYGDYIPRGGYEPFRLGLTNQNRVVRLYAEGIKPSGDYADERIKVFILLADPQVSLLEDAVRVTVVQADLDVDTDNNDTIDDYDDPIEHFPPGAVIPKDAAGDSPESGPIEECFEQLKLKVTPVLTGKVILDTNPAYAGSGIKVYTSGPPFVPANEVALPHTYDPASSLPDTLYVDGVTKNLNPDLTLTYKATIQTRDVDVAADALKVLVVETVSWSPAKEKLAYWWSSLTHLGEGDGVIWKEEIEKQGFTITKWQDLFVGGAYDNDFHDCTLGHYKQLCGAGTFYVISHGLPGAHAAVYAEDSAAGQAAINAWIAGESNMRAERFRDQRGWFWTARVSSTWHAANYKPTSDQNRAITFWSICYSATADPGGEQCVRDQAGGRWRIGYIQPTYEGECETTNTTFLKRMNGREDNTQRRTAGEAYDNKGVGYPANVEMKGNNWTTLCPSPMLKAAGPPRTYLVWPPDQSAVGQRFGWGCIVFDTYMDDTKAANQALIDVSGLPTFDHRWARGDPQRDGRYMLGFDFDNSKDTQPQNTTTQMRAVATQCANKDPDGGRALDGDREANNEDNRDWQYTTR